MYFHNVTIRNQYSLSHIVYKRTHRQSQLFQCVVGYVFPIEDIHLQFPADKSADLKLQSLLEADPLAICSWSLQVPGVLFSLQCNSINSIPPALIGPLLRVKDSVWSTTKNELLSPLWFQRGRGELPSLPPRAKAISSVTGNRSTAPGCCQCLCSLPSLTSPCWVFVHLPEHVHTLTSIRVSRADRPSCFHFLSTSFRLIDHTLLSFSLIWKRHQETINIWWQVGTEEKDG